MLGTRPQQDSVFSSRQLGQLVGLILIVCGCVCVHACGRLLMIHIIIIINIIVGKVPSESAQEFQMRVEDFPSLPGSSSGSSGSKTTAGE